MEAGNGLDAVEMAKNRPTGALAVGMVGRLTEFILTIALTTCDVKTVLVQRSRRFLTAS